jgi:adenylosuccinate lyase
MEIEAVLAEVQADLGLIPAEAARDIRHTARIKLLDTDRIQQEASRTGHSLIPLLRAWEAVCPESSAQYLHFGATTQDIQDTALALECREACQLVESRLTETCKHLQKLASDYRLTLIVGRTHLQAAIPTTLGVIFSTWLDECCRNLERLRSVRVTVSAAQLFSGVGTMSAFKGKGEELLKAFSERQGLQAPLSSWHTSRDRTVEFIATMGLVSGALANIANEIYQLSRTGIGELREPFGEHALGSSTMPHKLNPERSEQVVTLFHQVKGNISTAYETLINEHQRDYRTLRLEWSILPQTLHCTVKALDLMNTLLSGLQVEHGNIKKNLEAVSLPLCSEALMFALAESIGKTKAFEVIRQAYADNPQNENELLAAIELHCPDISPEMKTQLSAALDLNKGVGEAGRIVDAVLEQSGKVLSESVN